MRLWEATSGLPLAILHGHSGDVYCAVLSEDGRLVTHERRCVARCRDDGLVAAKRVCQDQRDEGVVQQP